MALAERRRVGRVFVERAQRDGAELLRRVGLEQMRAAVDGVHRLARRRVARETARRRATFALSSASRIAASDLSGIVVSAIGREV